MVDLPASVLGILETGKQAGEMMPATTYINAQRIRTAVKAAFKHAFPRC